MPNTQLSDDLRPLFHGIFAPPGEHAVVRDVAASAVLCAHLVNLVDTRTAQLHQGAVLADAVLARCVAMLGVREAAFEQADIHRDIRGLIVGTVGTTSACVANVLDYLLSNPGILGKTITAARVGTQDAIRSHIDGALRFKL